ncbi:hypothetical protein [Shewanella cyperi]|uniref:hypothetical protein n=1 Tax=Shewanella cyperi TaxID=2814292 RepID=UPI001A94D671|nr:hypothetical protein [Shewanella cyperi]QSX40075.1 hypothetical protein JYB84_13990 [Shewanella cyperi]
MPTKQLLEQLYQSLTNDCEIENLKAKAENQEAYHIDINGTRVHVYPSFFMNGTLRVELSTRVKFLYLFNKVITGSFEVDPVGNFQFYPIR